MNNIIEVLAWFSILFIISMLSIDRRKLSMKKKILLWVILGIILSAYTIYKANQHSISRSNHGFYQGAKIEYSDNIELSNESSFHTSIKTPFPEEGWVRLEIKNIGSIDYPSDLFELQSGDYRKLVREHFVKYEIPLSDFTLQQVGLNEEKPSAFEKYVRVVFKTSYLKPNEKVFRATEKYSMNQKDLNEIQSYAIKNATQGYLRLKSLGLGDNRIVDPGSIEIVEINGMFPILWTYKRQLNDNPVVLERNYSFFNYDKTHSLSFACRVKDQEQYEEIFRKILLSFRLIGE